MNNIILNIDASSASLYVSISKNGIVLAELLDDIQKNHCATIQPFVQQLLIETKLQLKDINAVAVMNGPGSYTGLRVALAAAKGYCFALDIPLITISNLASIGYSYFNNNQYPDSIICAISPMKNELIYATVNKDVEIVTAEKHIVADLHQSSDFLIGKVIGNMPEEVLKAFQISNYQLVLPELQHINAIGFSYFNKKIFANLVESHPFYIKEIYIN
jgi:tRNA threonylcarbamoyladenosine biosynthesis protein TsaB